MLENKLENKGSWWATLPGIITGAATLITAIGGLIAILGSNGFFAKAKGGGTDNSYGIAASSVNGQFPQASSRLLTEGDMNGLSSRDLKIMRNEIFARHGFKFQTREMRDYFNNQAWYKPVNDDVSGLLSSVEASNVDFIKRHE